MFVNSPFLSICIPAYNQTKYLVKTLDSIFNQTFKDFEVIISDDSTTRDVEELVSTYVDHQIIKIVYLRNKPSLGSPKNWNNAISFAKGKWIKIMHHDDWFCEHNALEKMISLASQHPNALIFAGIKGEIISENRKYINLPSQQKIESIRLDPFSLIWANIIGPPSTILFPKVEVTFDSRLIWLVDIEFYLQFY
jgi:glycosyltransferase involved in cell wall biosynthesis